MSDYKQKSCDYEVYVPEDKDNIYNISLYCTEEETVICDDEKGFDALTSFRLVKR